jgi:biotin carboxyl carrier protein
MEYFQWRALPEDLRPQTPAEIETDRLTGADNEAVAAADMLRKLLHPEDYEGIHGILEKASRLELSELVITKGDFSLALSGAGNGAAANRPRRQPADAAEPSPAAAPPAAAGDPPPADSGETIAAVMAGSFYLSTGDAGPFVAEGAVAEPGDTICLLEAMKLFNEIKAPFRCRIVRILLENATKVSKGQPLMVVEKLP